ncbi:TRAP transporter permease [Pseudohoeflea coraliihabitans]|uniref:TRAP transporter fused permease subunit n=1 Tax=Pseudohoeflea coraliihabitans TaxID=2860393 RepID=A0ABS6WQA5_9HYPH|nr:TRAP transporter fused permease subunit [Pseudohoeflea sp. DP4N28-3]MBW3097244.1 TRAP transporter fused permease subunit [Pseudohoeflea sp. DP4N28-3]
MKNIARHAITTGVRRKLDGRFGSILRMFAFATAVYTVYAATLSTWDVLARTIIFLTLMLTMLFLLVGASEDSDPLRPSIPDYALSALSLACLVFFTVEMDEVAQRITLFDPLPLSYWFFGYALLLLALEAARRTVGLGLTSIVLVIMAYNLWGHHFDGPLRHGYISLAHLLDISVFTTDGIFGVPVQVTATYAFLFVMFGTLLERAGGGQFFFDLAASLTGRRPGGPAKVAVCSSGLFGMVSGSPTADVVTTGSVTIPVMKRLGYSPTLAGGVEVAASTGGSIMPPVMGAAVFIMAEFTGIPYTSIVVASIIPAVLYYVCVFLQVDFRSRKLGLLGLSESELPRFTQAIKGGWLFLFPLVALTVALAQHYTPTYVALFGLVALLAVWLLKWSTFSLRALYDGISQTSFNMVAVTGACAAAGLVIGGITMTGLAGKVSELLILIAGSNSLVTLIIAAAMTILLGMGMPTPAAYALAAALLGPTLTGEFGFSLMQSHLFLLYFAVLSAMTPPVAVAAYAASAIADANPFMIAVTACRLAVAAFLLPFAFMFAPGILLLDTVPNILIDVVSTAAAVVAISMSVEGFIRQRISMASRLTLGCGALALLAPRFEIVLVGLIITLIGAGLAYRNHQTRLVVAEKERHLG